MICSTNSPVRELLALGAAEVDRLLQDRGAHLEDAPGHDVVERGHALEQGDVLEGAADALHRRLVRAHVAVGPALVGDRALLGLVEAVDHVEHGRLAGAVRADDGADLALPDVEADVGQRGDAAKAQADAVDREEHLIEAARAGPRARPVRRRAAIALAIPPPAAPPPAGTHVADRHLGPDHAGAAVLEGHLRLDRNAVPARVQRLDQFAVALVDHAAAHLARARELAVVGVQLLVEQQETGDLLRRRQRRVDLLDLAARSGRRPRVAPRDWCRS